MLWGCAGVQWLLGYKMMTCWGNCIWGSTSNLILLIQDHVYELLNTIDACQCFFDIVSIYWSLTQHLLMIQSLTVLLLSLLWCLLLQYVLHVPHRPNLLLFSLSGFFFIIIINLAPPPFCIMYILLFISVSSVSWHLIHTLDVGILSF